MKLFLFLSAFASLPATNYAWGRDGHAIIADIAQGRLSQQAALRVNKLLGPGINMSDVSSWADVQQHYPGWGWSTPLHFTNVKDPSKNCRTPEGWGDCVFEYSRDCVDSTGAPNRCNAGAIVNYTQQLQKQPTVNNNTTQTALNFLIHFVGDIHQPLHCGMIDDRGGNSIPVVYNSKYEEPYTNLHKVWDVDLIVEKQGGEGIRFALLAEIQALLAGQWQQQAKSWAQSTVPAGWVQESLEVATAKAYRFSNGTEIHNVTRDGPILPHKYYTTLMAQGGTVEAQLAKGGVRLAALLNSIFKK